APCRRLRELPPPCGPGDQRSGPVRERGGGAGVAPGPRQPAPRRRARRQRRRRLAARRGPVDPAPVRGGAGHPGGHPDPHRRRAVRSRRPRGGGGGGVTGGRPRPRRRRDPARLPPPRSGVAPGPGQGRPSRPCDGRRAAAGELRVATTKRDYYEVLGVGRAAPPDELKKAYRRLAMKFHPDRNQGDKQAEERFKEIGEAYAVLSDPEKRQRYDAFGHASDEMPFGGGFTFESAFDLFDMFFGGGGRRRGRTGPQRGSDLRMTLEISLGEAVFGATRTVDVPRADTCPECSGTGAEGGAKAVTCPQCQGAGQVRRVVQSVFGQVVNVSSCPRCHGEGHIVENPCRRCRGQGRVESRKTLEVSIPAGVDED